MTATAPGPTGDRAAREQNWIGPRANLQAIAVNVDVLTGPLNLKRHRSTPPVDEPWNDPRLDEGIRIYNEGHHWHAHECWEPLWMGLEGDDKLFVQGLIMSAAMLHQYGRKVPKGVVNHWHNVLQRLSPHAPTKWRIDVAGLLAQLRPYVEPVEAGDRVMGLDPTAVRIARRNA